MSPAVFAVLFLLSMAAAAAYWNLRSDDHPRRRDTPLGPRINPMGGLMTEDGRGAGERRAAPEDEAEELDEPTPQARKAERDEKEDTEGSGAAPAAAALWDGPARSGAPASRTATREQVVVPPHSSWTEASVTRQLAERLIALELPGVRRAIIGKALTILALALTFFWAARNVALDEPVVLPVFCLLLQTGTLAWLLRRKATPRQAGLIYLPVSALPYNDGEIVLDLAGIADAARLELVAPRRPGELQARLESQHAQLAALPPVLEREPRLLVRHADGSTMELHDVEAGILRDADGLHALLEDRTSQALPLRIVDWCRSGQFLSGDAVARTSWPVLRLRESADVRQEFDAVAGRLASAREAGGGLDARLRILLQDIESVLHRLGELRREALLDAIPAYHLSVACMSDLASFSFYCPSCNQRSVDTTDSDGDGTLLRPQVATRLEYDPVQDRWLCPLCSSATTTPLAMHRILDELLFPAFEFLLEENRTERLRVYHDARQRKQAFTNKWEQEKEQAFQGNREAREIVESRIRDLSTRLSKAKHALAGFGLIIAQIESLRATRLSESQVQFERRTAEIAESNRAFLRRQSEFVSGLRSQLSRDIEACAKVARVERRQEMELLGRMAQAAEETAAVQKTWAHVQGWDRGRGLLGVPRNVGLAIQGFAGEVSGQSLVQERRPHGV